MRFESPLLRRLRHAGFEDGEDRFAVDDDAAVWGFVEVGFSDPGECRVEARMQRLVALSVAQRVGDHAAGTPSWMNSSRARMLAKAFLPTSMSAIFLP